MVTPENIKRLIAKELRGKLSAAERKVLDTWYDSQFEAAFSDGSFPDMPSRKFGKLKRKLSLSHAEYAIRYWVAAAAATLFFFFLFHFQVSEVSETSPTASELESQFETVQNDRGVRRSITLADGSRIFLNSSSKIDIHKKFSTNRVVRLEGEAYFEVAKDSLHPFLVQTSELETSVLGTSFSIRAFKDLPQMIAVKDGKVNVIQVAGNGQQRMLTQNDQLIVSTEMEFGKTTKIDPQNLFAWVEGTLVFEERPLPDVLKALSEWYALESLDIQNIGKNCKVTGTYTKMKLVDIMESIKYATGITYELNGKHLKVKSGNC